MASAARVTNAAVNLSPTTSRIPFVPNQRVGMSHGRQFRLGI